MKYENSENSQWFMRYRYLKIWTKYLIGTKTHHFELTFSVITSGLKDQSNLVQVKFLAWEGQKLHLEYTKTNQCSVISHFNFLFCLTGSGTGKVCGNTVIFLKKFSSETKDISLNILPKLGLGSLVDLSI